MYLHTLMIMAVNAISQRYSLWGFVICLYSWNHVFNKYYYSRPSLIRTAADLTVARGRRISEKFG